MCFDICPVQVFDFDQGKNLAKVARQDDCIGCLSCFYVCPAQCLTLSEVDLIRPFHRIEENVALVEKFLQMKAAVKTISDADCDEAQKDVAVRLSALAGAITETMGRGQKAVGRKSGNVAAAHFPEMYEGKNLTEVLERMQKRFKHSFVFDFKVDNNSVDLNFHPCALYAVANQLGEKVGDAVLCQIFHEYWAGLLGAFTGLKYQAETKQVGQTCAMRFNGS